MKTATLLMVTLALVALPAYTFAADTQAAQSPEQIRMVQRALTDRGFAVELSGAYDDQTKTALSDFQRSRGLSETGTVDSETASALGLDPAQTMPVRGATAKSAEPKTKYNFTGSAPTDPYDSDNGG